MSNHRFLKGIAIGAATGAAVGMLIAPRNKKHKCMAGKALRTAGNFAWTIKSIFLPYRKLRNLEPQKKDMTF